MYQVHFLFDTLTGAVRLVFDVEGPDDRAIVVPAFIDVPAQSVVPILSPWYDALRLDMCLSQSESFIFYFVPFTLFMPRATLNGGGLVVKCNAVIQMSERRHFEDRRLHLFTS